MTQYIYALLCLPEGNYKLETQAIVPK